MDTTRTADALRYLRAIFNAEQTARREPADATVMVSFSEAGDFVVGACGADWDCEGVGSTLELAIAECRADYRRGWELAS